MFAHPWAIIRRSALNSSVDTEEANVRPALGDHSLPRQVPKDEHSSPSYTHTLARGRTFAQHWAIVRPRGKLPHVTYLGHFHLILPSLSHTPPPSITPPTLHISRSSPTTTNHYSTHPQPPPPPHNTISGHPIPLQGPPFSIFPLSANISPTLHNPFHNHNCCCILGLDLHE
jgi:hypothetical protein